MYGNPQLADGLVVLARRGEQRDPAVVARGPCQRRYARRLRDDQGRHRHTGQALRRRARGRGIRVNAAAPSVVNTDMLSFARTEAGKEFTLGIQALERVGEPDDIGPVIVLLASDAARWISGGTLRVDGGSKL